MSSSLEIQKICLFCGKEFIAKKTTTQYCSLQCSQRAYKKRKREEKINVVTKKTENLQPLTLPFPIPIKEYLNVQEMADLMGISRVTAYRYCVSAIVPCMKINRKIFIRRKDIEHCFNTAGPYIVKPLTYEHITEFYSLKEIMQKYNCSERQVYEIVKDKKVPKTKFRGNTLYSKKHIDRHFASKAPDSMIQNWYSVKEIEEKYGMTTTAVYSFTSENVISKKKENGKVYFASDQVDILLKHRIPDPTIAEWYSMDDIVEKYRLTPQHVSSLVFKNPIPKKRVGNRSYFSKVHFDRLIKEKEIVPEYYTVEEAMKKFNATRDSLAYICKKYGVPKIKEGRCVKLAKKELDKIYLQQPKIEYSNDKESDITA